MTLLNKIRKLRANHKIARIIADGATAFAAGNATAAALDTLAGTQTIAEAKADFYDGCRGPNQLQLDQRVTLGDKVNYTLLPKGFVNLSKKGGLFGVTPFSFTPGENPAFGVGMGGFYNLGKVSLLGVLPVVYNAQGDTTNINPTLYATIMAGDLLIDPRISYLASISDEGTTHNLSFATTMGYKIDNVLLGFDIGTGIDPSNPTTEQLEENLNYQGIIRIDLDPKHKNWIQAYFGPKAVGIGFRTNFDWK